MKKYFEHFVVAVIFTTMIAICVLATSFDSNAMTSKNDVVDNPICVKHLTEKDFKSVNASGREIISRLGLAPNIMRRTTAVGDQYEPNDGIVGATQGVQGQVIQATIHSATDMDFYQFEVNANEELSILLYNIPSGCDYDLYLFNSNQSAWYTDFQDGSLSEEFYISLNESGTYYVAVDSNSGYSESPYSLYFGFSYVYGDTGWIEPGYSFAFGSVPRGTLKTLSAKTINLTNQMSIPDGATVDAFYLSNEGNGDDYAGFTKYLEPASGHTVQQYGALQVMPVPANTLVKQNWRIWGSVSYSDYFTWEPRYLVQYKFFVTPRTTRFL